MGYVPPPPPVSGPDAMAAPPSDPFWGWPRCFLALAVAALLAALLT
jgi:hypothetical protein